MIAYVLVVDTPVFEKTGKDGTARFGNLPAGPHRSMVWVPGMREPVSLPQATLAEDESKSISHRLQAPVKRQPPAPPFDPQRYSLLLRGKTQQAGDICTSAGS